MVMPLALAMYPFDHSMTTIEASCSTAVTGATECENSLTLSIIKAAFVALERIVVLLKKLVTVWDIAVRPISGSLAYDISVSTEL